MSSGSIEVFDGAEYVSIPGTPGPQLKAQVSDAPPTARGVGDIWTDTSSNLLDQWDDEWQYATLLNGWVDYNASSYGPARFRKTAGGIVNLVAMIKSGTVGDTSKPALILPPGYRPDGEATIPGTNVNQNKCRIIFNVGSNWGYVNVHVGDPYWVSIHTCFLAER